MVKDIKTVAILGSGGTIGCLTGGIIAQEGIKVYFLSRTKDAAIDGQQKAIEQARSEIIVQNIICGDYESLLETAMGEADWVVEAVAEDINIKKLIYKKITPYLRPDTIISSTTSSLPLDKIAEALPKEMQCNFLSTHFYNPPGKMLACEIACLDRTNPEVYNFMKDFLEKKLRRSVIPVKNIAGFAGNRIAFLLFGRITQMVSDYGTEMMDYLIGPYTGRLMAPLATLDLVGLDIHKAIIESLRNNTNDQMHDLFALPDYIDTMIEKGLLGNKTKAGFYKRLEGGRKLFFDPATGDYIPAVQPHIGFVEQAKHLIHLGMYREAFETIKNARGKEADIVTDILCMYISYAYNRIGGVTDAKYGINGIDKVMSAGFHWAPPSLILNLLGGKKEVSKMLNQKGQAAPAQLQDTDNMELQIIESGKYLVAR
jgi:3-hydroxyacyl-CoA dehydrogenase